MADDDATDDGTLLDLRRLLFGSGDDEDPAAEPDGETAIEGNRAEWRPSGGEGSSLDATADVPYGAGAIEPVEGYRAEWRPSGGGDVDAAGEVSYVDAGGTEARLHIADDVKHADNADPWGNGPHEVDIGGSLDEPTEIWLGPAEGGDPVEPDVGAVTEVSDTDAPLAATDSSRFEDVD